MQLNAKVVLITGASEGIGAACAAAFRSRGARLSLIARSEEKLRLVAKDGDLITAGDLRSSAVRDDFVRRTIDRFGRADILVNNAGVGLYVPASRASLEETRAMFELNVFAPIHLVQLVLGHMRAHRSGMIVNVSSIAGKVTLPWFTLYSASKYALGALSDGLRMELRSEGIHCLTVCPGYVKTGFQRNVLSGHPPDLSGWRARSAITPEKCAAAIVRGVERDARTVVTPRRGWILIALARMFPSLVDRQLERIYLRQVPNP